MDKVAGVATLEPPHAVPEEPYEDHLLEEGTEDIVSGTSQISAAGKACIPCGCGVLVAASFSDPLSQPQKESVELKIEKALHLLAPLEAQ